MTGTTSSDTKAVGMGGVVRDHTLGRARIREGVTTAQQKSDIEVRADILAAARSSVGVDTEKDR